MSVAGSRVASSHKAAHAAKASNPVPVKRAEHTLKFLTAKLEITHGANAIHINHDDLSRQLHDPSNLGFLVLDIFNPPDERLLDLHGFKTVTDIECFLERRDGHEVDTEIMDAELVTHFTLFRDVKHTSGVEEMARAIAAKGLQGWRMVGLHDPPDKVSGWFALRTSVQIVFQQYVHEREGVEFHYKVRKLDVRPQNDTIEILELSPTLQYYGAKGYRLVCTLNPPECRTRQRLKQPSHINFFFQRRKDRRAPADEGEMYKHQVVKCVVRVTRDARGTTVKGDWKKIIRDQYANDWTISTIIDVPDEVNGLTTLLLVFHQRVRLVRRGPGPDSASAKAAAASPSRARR